MLAAAYGGDYRPLGISATAVASAADEYWQDKQPAQPRFTLTLPSPASVLRGMKDAVTAPWADWGVSHKLGQSAVVLPVDTMSAAAGTKDEDKGVRGGVDPSTEGNPDDLVLESWAHCISKNKYASSKDDTVEHAPGVQQFKQRHMWRRRTSWIALDCGEDSFFVSNNRKVVGVADGVGGWRATNIDPSEISNAMMEESKKVTEEERDNLNPLDVMTKAFTRVVSRGTIRGGSTTTLVAALETDDNEKKREGRATGKMHIANLGDSGLLQFRGGHVRHRAQEQQHSFNAPYQLAIIPRKAQGKMACISDPPSKALQETVDVREDDIFVLGTDGLFDNMHNSELKQLCDSVLNTTGDYGDYYTPWGKWTRNSRARCYAKDMVKQIVGVCQLNARSKTYVTPFSYALMENGVASADEAKGMLAFVATHSAT